MFYHIAIPSLWSRTLCLLSAVLFLGVAEADNPDLLTALSAQGSLTTFTSLIHNYTSLLSAAQAGNITGTWFDTCHSPYSLLLTVIFQT
jgi:hypothetical protein